MLGHFSLSHVTVRSSRCNIPRASCGGWWLGHDAIMWSADCSFAPHSQVGVDAMHLCIAAGKRSTPVFSLLDSDSDSIYFIAFTIITKKCNHLIIITKIYKRKQYVLT